MAPSGEEWEVMAGALTDYGAKRWTETARSWNDDSKSFSKSLSRIRHKVSKIKEDYLLDHRFEKNPLCARALGCAFERLGYPRERLLNEHFGGYEAIHFQMSPERGVLVQGGLGLHSRRIAAQKYIGERTLASVTAAIQPADDSISQGAPIQAAVVSGTPINNVFMKATSSWTAGAAVVVGACKQVTLSRKVARQFNASELRVCASVCIPASAWRAAGSAIRSGGVGSASEVDSQPPLLSSSADVRRLASGAVRRISQVVEDVRSAAITPEPSEDTGGGAVPSVPQNRAALDLVASFGSYCVGLRAFAGSLLPDILVQYNGSSCEDNRRQLRQHYSLGVSSSDGGRVQKAHYYHSFYFPLLGGDHAYPCSVAGELINVMEGAQPVGPMKFGRGQHMILGGLWQVSEHAAVKARISTQSEHMGDLAFVYETKISNHGPRLGLAANIGASLSSPRYGLALTVSDF